MALLKAMAPGDERRRSTWAGELRRHPSHLALCAFVAGLLTAGAGVAGWAGPLAIFAALSVAAATRRALLALAVIALFLGGAWTGSARLEAIDRSQVGPWLGEQVRMRGHVVRRERPVLGVSRCRVRATWVRGRGSPEWHRADDLVQVRARRGGTMAALAIGDEIDLEGALSAPGSSRRAPYRRRERGFDYAGYLRRAGVHAVLEASAVRPTGGRRGGLPGGVDRLRRRAEAGVTAGLGPSPAALARGIVLGQDEQIAPAEVDRFKDSGLAHLLAVSGQNVVLLALLALPVLAALGLGRRGRLVGVLALIAVYVPLTGAGPSVLRAGAMGAAGTVAALAGRPASRWYGLLLAAAFTLALDPRAYLDAGWQLSFAAVIGILVLVAPLTEALGRLPQALAAGVAVTVAATLATAPLMAFHFERVSLVSLVANLLALPAVAPIMWLGTLAGAAGQVSPAASALFNALNGYCLGYLAAIAGWTAALPAAAVEARLGSRLALAASYVALGALALWLRGRPPRAHARDRGARRPLRRLAVTGAIASALTLVCALGLAAAGGPRAPERFTVTFLDVGQGDATLLQAPGGTSALVDGGPPDSGIAEKLRSAGVRRLDLAVLTHAQDDHQGGLEAVARAFDVGVLLDGGAGDHGATHARVIALARARGARVVAARAGQVLRAGALSIRVLSPPAGLRDATADPNDGAAVLLASYRGIDVFLPADAESNVTTPLDPPDVELLKVAHHGSADDGLPALLERLRPGLAVIEVGASNRYGHPNPATVATLQRLVPDVLRTDRDGDVRVSLEGDQLAVDRGE